MMNHTMTLILITIIVALSIALIVAIAQISVFRKMTRSLNDIVMNARQFFDKVVAMRKFQRDYFKTRSNAALRQSKQIEAEIDREIERVQAIIGTSQHEPKQGSIFDFDNTNR